MQIPKLQPEIISPLAGSATQVLGKNAATNTNVPLILLVGAVLTGMATAALVARRLLKKRKRQTPVTTLAKE